MRTSASGAPVLRKSSESNGGENLRATSKPSPAGKARWSGSLQELAARKRATQQPSGQSDVSAVKPATQKAAGSDAPRLPPPPALAPPSVRSRLMLFYRNWNCDRRWQVPCWLASLLLHLLAVVVLGSLTVPVSRQRTIVSLLLSFGDVAARSDEGADEGTVELAATAIEPLEEPAEQPNGEDSFLDFNNLSAVQTDKPDESPPPQDQADQPQPEQLATATGSLPGTAPPGQAETPQGGAAQTRVIDVANDEQNNVVDRFIQYDIGRLLGDEGIKARDEFQRLGPDAIASLVRGLNKSANIHASCPVVVISFKIEAVLRENPDPALVRYALKNIGHGVPSNAPHLGRLQSLLAQIRKLRQPHSSPNVTMVLAALQGRDRQKLLNAAEVVVASCDKFLDSEKRDIAWGFIRLLTHNDAGVRGAAHQALVALADGTDLGPANDRRPADRLAAAAKWSIHVDEERFEAAAAAVLKTGRHLEEAGKQDAARRYYNKLVREYPGTSAADEAAELLEQPKVFAFK